MSFGLWSCQAASKSYFLLEESGCPVWFFSPRVLPSQGIFYSPRSWFSFLVLFLALCSACQRAPVEFLFLLASSPVPRIVFSCRVILPASLSTLIWLSRTQVLVPSTKGLVFAARAACAGRVGVLTQLPICTFGFVLLDLISSPSQILDCVYFYRVKLVLFLSYRTKKLDIF
jgi:hypothetical protein